LQQGELFSGTIVKGTCLICEDIEKLSARESLVIDESELMGTLVGYLPPELSAMTHGR
jgi:hypothetical protein